MRPVHWIGSSLDDLRALPLEVGHAVGYALYLAQCGGKHPSAKVLHGFGGTGVLEIVENFDGNTYRAVYTVRFSGVFYVLHVFQKKSKRGIKTPRGDMALVQSRLQRAREHYASLQSTRR